MKAIDVLDMLLQRVFMIDRYKARPGHPGKPGEMIEHLTDEQRDALKELKPTDIIPSAIPGAAYYCSDFYTKRQYDKSLSEAKLEFDTKLNK